MKDLGLSQLTDEQIIELLMELCAELTERDPFIRKAAQGVINDEAIRLKAKREAVKVVLKKARSIYIRQLKKDVLESIDLDFIAGTFPLFTADQEAKIIYEITKKRKGELRSEKKKEIYARALSEMRQQILDGTLDLYGRDEEKKDIEAATQKAAEILRQQGVISLERYQQGRAQIFRSLEAMGHRKEDILKIYGKP